MKVVRADLDLTRAKEQATAYQIPKAITLSELLANPEIELFINLTIPQVHASVCLESLEAGKHVYVEKPLAVQTQFSFSDLNKRMPSVHIYWWTEGVLYFFLRKERAALNW